MLMPPISIQKTTYSRLPEVDINNVPFGKVFSDHMLYADYDNGQWQEAQIVPYGNMEFSPAMSALHYGQAFFEGMKAEKDAAGNIYLFRPLENFKRFNHSAWRLQMPALPEDIFMDGLRELLHLDSDWIPTGEGASLYIRPVMFATDPMLGVRASDTYRFIIITCPVGAYYSGGIKVYIETEYSRACKGGIGSAKAAGNYGGALYPTYLAKQKGYDQVLWTDADTHTYLEEAGTMNIFFIIDGKVITPELDGTILEGITRKSLIELFKDEGYKVEERPLSISEVLEAADKGTLQDCFGAGTAAVLTHVSTLGYKDKLIQLPPIAGRPSVAIKERFIAINKGQAADKFGWIEKI